uniref:2c protein n=1 Tax=Tobacco rattle virus TaxID=12295 RepID=E6Y0K2_9VIRU|nr:2c protein [Tobacco rattle virus]
MTSASVVVLKSKELVPGVLPTYEDRGIINSLTLRNRTFNLSKPFVEADGAITTSVMWSFEIDKLSADTAVFELNFGGTVLGHIRLEFLFETSVKPTVIGSFNHSGFSNTTKEILIVNDSTVGKFRRFWVDQEIIRGDNFRIAFKWPNLVRDGNSGEYNIVGLFHSHKARPHTWPLISGLFTPTTVSKVFKKEKIKFEYQTTISGDASSASEKRPFHLTIVVASSTDLEELVVDFDIFDSPGWSHSVSSESTKQSKKVTFVLTSVLPRGKRCYWLGNFSIIVKDGKSYHRVLFDDLVIN